MTKRFGGILGILAGTALFLACSGAEAEKTQNVSGSVTYLDAFPGIKFTRPLLLTEFPGKQDTFVVLEQPGNVQVVGRNGSAWAKTRFAVMEVTGGRSGGDERGLLGFAFHPEYRTNRKYYVFYVKGSANVLAEGIADTTLLKDSGAPLRILLNIPDPYANHNGGTIGFGPKDGFLYIGTGDGGSGGDPEGNGQNKNTLLGKMLRIDVNSQDYAKPYAIPKDNPFVGGGGAPEVWAYGLRNPWKWDFDSVTGDLWAGDVGQNRLEEISIIEKGGNYGWNVWEGDQCYPRGGTDCDLPGHKPPVFTYGRDAKGGISVTGGIFYRGNSSSPYFESYLFGDYGTNNVWSLKKNGQAKVLPQAPDISISSFGKDSRGRVYIMGVGDDVIYRMDGLDDPSAAVGGRK